MIPRPVVAFIFLFPLTENYEKHNEEEEVWLTKHEQNVNPDVIFFKQTIANACGMIALLHSLANNDSLVGKLSFFWNMTWLLLIIIMEEYSNAYFIYIYACVCIL